MERKNWRDNFISRLDLQFLEIEKEMDDTQFIKKCLDKDCLVFEDLPENFRNDPSVMQIAMKYSPHFITLASSELKSDPVFIRSLNSYPMAYLHLPEILKSDRDLCAQILYSNTQALRYMPAEVKDDANLVLTVLLKESKDEMRHLVKEASIRLRNDKDFMTKAITFLTSNIFYASEELKDDKEFLLAAIESDPQSLQYASERLRDDSELVLQCVLKDPKSIGYASDRIKDDEEFILYLLDKVPDSKIHFIIFHCSAKLMDSQPIINKLCEKNENYIIFASERLWEDKELIMKLLFRENFIMCNLSPRLLDDEDFAYRNIKKYPETYVYFSERIRSISELTDIAVDYDSSLVEFRPQKLKENEILKIIYNIYDIDGNIDEVIKYILGNFKRILLLPDKFRKSKEFVRKCLQVKEISIDFLRYFLKEIREDKEIIIEFSKLNEEAFKIVPFKLHDDRDFMKQLVQLNPDIL
jgi:hypothetical protein